MKTIYCAGCSTKVAMIADGSKLKKGMVCLCDVCEICGGEIEYCIDDIDFGVFEVWRTCKSCGHTDISVDIDTDDVGQKIMKQLFDDNSNQAKEENDR